VTVSAEKREVLNPLEKGMSKYKMVILAARRALELSEGAPRLVEADPKSKPAIVSIQEIAEGKVSYRLKKQPK